MRRFSSGVMWGALLFFALGYFLVMVGKGQPLVAHYVIFQRAHSILDIYADKIVAGSLRETSFYYQGHLIATLHPDSGLVWRRGK